MPIAKVFTYINVRVVILYFFNTIAYKRCVCVGGGGLACVYI